MKSEAMAVAKVRRGKRSDHKIVGRTICASSSILCGGLTPAVGEWFIAIGPISTGPTCPVF